MTTLEIVRNRLVKQWLAILLFAGLILMFLFKERIQEPYPGPFQPSFKQTAPLDGTLNTTEILLVATTLDGKQLKIDYSELFFPIQNYSYFFYLKIPDKALGSPEVANRSTSAQGSLFYRYFIQSHEIARKKKDIQQYDDLLRYLEEHAELLTQQDIVNLRFNRYKVTKDLKTDQIDSALIEVKNVSFEKD